MPTSAPFIYFILLFFVARYWWRKFHAHRENMKFTFRITDIWAAMIGLSPSMLIVSAAVQSLERSKDPVEWEMVFSLAAFAAAQIVGLLIGRVHIELPPHTGAKNAFESAVSIWTGALIGLFICMGCAAVTLVLFAMLRNEVFMWIVGSVLIAAAFIAAYWRPR